MDVNRINYKDILIENPCKILKPSLKLVKQERDGKNVKNTVYKMHHFNAMSYQ